MTASRKSGERSANASVTTLSGIRSSASVSADRSPRAVCDASRASCQSSTSGVSATFGERCCLR